MLHQNVDSIPDSHSRRQIQATGVDCRATAFDIAGSGDTLARLEENLDERVAQAAGKVRVASDHAAQGDWVMKAEEEEALEAQALAEFASAMGIQTPSAHATQFLPAEELRDLGPTQTS